VKFFITESMKIYKLLSVSVYILACLEGQYYDDGLGACQACPIGQYQNQRAELECKVCPVGMTTTVTGAVNIDQCTGEYCGSALLL